MHDSKLPFSQLFNGLFGERNYNLMGDSFVIDPGYSNVSSPIIIQKNLGRSSALTAVQKYNNVHSVLTVTATPIKDSKSGVTFAGLSQNLQLSLSFISGGNSLFGVAQEPPPVIVGYNQQTLLSTDILIDCNNAVISLPACSQFNVTYRHTAKYSDTLPFPPGAALGPSYRVNVGFAYGTPKSIQSWYTDIPTILNYSGNIADPPPNAMWAKPQFAEALTLNLFSNGNINLLSGYINLTFYDALMCVIHQSRYMTPFSSFPLIRWPQGAAYVAINTANITSSEGLTHDQEYFKIAPVHAIRL